MEWLLKVNVENGGEENLSGETSSLNIRKTHVYTWLAEECALIEEAEK